jgi:hypothetical protein
MNAICKCCKSTYEKREKPTLKYHHKLKDNKSYMNQTFCDACCEEIFHRAYRIGYNKALRSNDKKRMRKS